MILEVSAVKQDGTVIFKEEKDYKNIGLSKEGEPVSAAWAISSYSEEKSTAFKPLEVKKETFRMRLAGESEEGIEVYVRIYSYHGLPTEFGKPADRVLVVLMSEKVKL